MQAYRDKFNEAMIAYFVYRRPYKTPGCADKLFETFLNSLEYYRYVTNRKAF